MSVVNDKKDKDYYFDSYSHYGIHEEMLKDESRTLAYKRAILENKHLFKDKIIMDIGAGTSILSLFAAEAGAKKVYAIECADIAHTAKKIVKLNGYDHIITIIHDKLENISKDIIPLHSIDIIISEWMGYFLLYESMFDSVLYARDHYLKSNGLLFPDQANIFLNLIEDDDYYHEKIQFWNNIDHFKFNTIKKIALLEPLVEECIAEQVVGVSTLINSINLHTITYQDLDYQKDYEIQVTKNTSIHAIIGYFDVLFSHCHATIKLQTGPYNTLTHWKQTIFYLQKPLYDLKRNDVIKGTISCIRNIGNNRDLDIVLTYQVVRNNKQIIPEKRQFYRLR